MLSAPGHSSVEVGTFGRMGWGREAQRVWASYPGPHFTGSLAGGQGALTPLGLGVQRPRSSAAVRPDSAARPAPRGSQGRRGLARRRLHGTRHTCAAGRGRPVHLPLGSLPRTRTLQSGGGARRSPGGHTSALGPHSTWLENQPGPHSPTMMSRTLTLLKRLRGRCHYKEGPPERSRRASSSWSMGNKMSDGRPWVPNLLDQALTKRNTLGQASYVH